MKVLFMGRKLVAANALRSIAAQPGIEVVGVLTDNHLAVSPTSEVARELGVPILGFSQALELSEAGALAFDLGISVLYWRKSRGALLRVPGKGVINFHPAPLPEYKGTAGYNLAILDNLSEWGVTAHYMDEQIDTGGIIECERFPIDPHHASVKDLETECMARIAEQIMRIFSAARETNSRLPTTPNVGGRYVSRDEMEAMKEIKAGDDINRKIRAFWYPPYDGAYIVREGEKFTLVNRSLLQRLGDPSASSLFSPPAHPEQRA